MRTQAPIDILKAANEKKRIEVEIIFPDTDLHAFLRAPDQYKIFEKQELLKRVAYGEAIRNNLANIPILEKEYRDETEREVDKIAKAPELSDEEKAERVKRYRESREREKPGDQAEQYANKVASYRTIIELIPQYLRDEKGNLLFPDAKAQGDFYEILTSDQALLDLLTRKYLELSDKINQARAEIKN